MARKVIPKEDYLKKHLSDVNSYIERLTPANDNNISIKDYFNNLITIVGRHNNNRTLNKNIIILEHGNGLIILTPKAKDLKQAMHNFKNSLKTQITMF